MRDTKIKRIYKGTVKHLKTSGYFDDDSALYDDVLFEYEDAKLIALMLNHYTTFAHYAADNED